MPKENENLYQQLKDIENRRKEFDVEERLLIDKALQSDNPSDIVKAMEVVKIRQNQSQDWRKSTFIDPYNFESSFGYKTSPQRINYETLNAMSRTPIINAILKTRKNQIAAFSQPQKDRFSTGFVLRKKGYFIEDTKKLSKAEMQKVEEITEFILNCGMGQAWSRDDFDTFLRKCTEDSLIFDQMTWENVRNRKGGMHEVLVTDSTTFRIADSYSDSDYKQHEREEIAGYYPSYVQVINNKITAEFYPWELCWGVRNPTSRLYSHGYGRSELEDLVGIVTGMLWSDQYNRNFFRLGAAPKGIIRLKGGANNPRMQEFRQQWRSMIAGVDNCISGDVVIYTKERGAVTVEDYLCGLDEKKATIWVGDSFQDGLVYRTSEKKRYCQTRIGNGECINTSPDHKFKIIGDNGELVWKEQKHLKKGDYVLLNKKVVEGDYIPVFRGARIEPELMEILGWMIGDGYMLSNKKQGNIQLNYHHEKEQGIMRRHEGILLNHLINVKTINKYRTVTQVENIREKYGFTDVANKVTFLGIYDSQFVRFLQSLGFRTSKEGKVIPALITNMPKEYIYSFLKGLFSADGNNAKRRSPAISITDTTLRNQTRGLLNAVGIRCNKSEGKGAGRFNTEKGKSNCLRIKDKDAFFSKIGFLQSHKQPKELINKNESCKHNRIANSFVIRHLLNIREQVKTGNVATCKLGLSERNQINSILIGKDGCSLNRLIRIADKAGYRLPKWAYEYYFEEVDEIIRTDILVDMYDVSINEERHQFIGNNILISNSWRTPIIDSESMEWIDLQKSHRDMEFTKWQEYLIKLACALYVISPEEIGFESGRSERGAQIFEGNAAKKIKYSQDKGLRPLLKFVESKINKYIVSQIAPDMVFEFVGLDAETEEEYRKRIIDEVTNVKTVNAVRKEYYNEKSLDGGDIILNPTFIQAKQMQQMEQQQGEGEEQFGAPGGTEEGAPPEEQGVNPEMAEEAFKEPEENPFAKSFIDMIDELNNE